MFIQLIYVSDMHGVKYRKLYSFITYSRRCDSAGIIIHDPLDAFLKVHFVEIHKLM